MITKNIKNIYFRLFKGSSKGYNVQLFRYLISGFFAFFVDALLLFLLTEYVHLYYLISVVIAYSVGLLVSYFTNIIWVFENRKKKQQSVELVIFIVISLLGLLFTFILMWLFTSELNIYYLYSKIITTIIVFIWNFVAKKWILF